MRQRVEEAVELAVVVLVAIGVGVLGALALLLVVAAWADWLG